MQSVALVPAVLLGAGGLAVLAGLVQGYRTWRLSRMIASTPPTAISGLYAGLHEVRGALHGDGVLDSPYSHKPCLYWRLVLEQRRRNRWETLVDRKATVPAWLDDGGGRLGLQLDQADVIVSNGQRISDGILGFPSSELTDLIARIGSEVEGLAGPYLRYHEEVLVSGDRLCAMGEVKADGEAWELAAGGDPNVVSDRDEAEVVSHQERVALRWIGVALIGVLLTASAFLLNPFATPA